MLLPVHCITYSAYFQFREAVENLRKPGKPVSTTDFNTYFFGTVLSASSVRIMKYIRIRSLLHIPGVHLKKQLNLEEKTEMFRIRAFPKPALVFAGSMDCFTTIIGILYFRAVESNPLLAIINSTNLPVYTAIKLSTVLFAALMFHQADKTLKKIQGGNSKSFTNMRYIARGAYMATTAFLLICAINNIITVARSI